MKRSRNIFLSNKISLEGARNIKKKSIVNAIKWMEIFYITDNVTLIM